PCCHKEKRTPPCVPLLLEKKFMRIWIAHRDPNPKVRGKAIEALRKAKIDVKVGLLAEEATIFNQPFIKNQTKRLPYVTLKLASTFDGKMADASGHSQWITTPAARIDSHHLRLHADAIGV